MMGAAIPVPGPLFGMFPPTCGLPPSPCHPAFPILIPATKFPDSHHDTPDSMMGLLSQFPDPLTYARECVALNPNHKPYTRRGPTVVAS
jgi:hypothetical protein